MLIPLREITICAATFESAHFNRKNCSRETSLISYEWPTHIIFRINEKVYTYLYLQNVGILKKPTQPTDWPNDIYD